MTPSQRGHHSLHQTWAKSGLNVMLIRIWSLDYTSNIARLSSPINNLYHEKSIQTNLYILLFPVNIKGLKYLICDSRFQMVFYDWFTSKAWHDMKKSHVWSFIHQFQSRNINMFIIYLLFIYYIFIISIVCSIVHF